jgi:hypothetical protein
MSDTSIIQCFFSCEVCSIYMYISYANTDNLDPFFNILLSLRAKVKYLKLGCNVRRLHVHSPRASDGRFHPISPRRFDPFILLRPPK